MGHESQRDVGLSSVRGVKCLPTQTGTQGEFSSPSKALMGTSDAAAAPHSACRVQDVSVLTGRNLGRLLDMWVTDLHPEVRSHSSGCEECSKRENKLASSSFHGQQHGWTFSPAAPGSPTAPGWLFQPVHTGRGWLSAGSCCSQGAGQSSPSC